MSEEMSASVADLSSRGTALGHRSSETSDPAGNYSQVLANSSSALSA
jgi:hypothetical protein